MASYKLASDIQVELQIENLEKKFRKACNQIHVLNERLDILQQRYNVAFNANQRTFRYTRRLQLTVLEGVRNMYVEYATAKADKLLELQTQLLKQELDYVHRPEANDTDPDSDFTDSESE